MPASEEVVRGSSQNQGHQLMQSGARDRNGIKGWNISTSSVVKKERWNRAEGHGSRIGKVLSVSPFSFCLVLVSPVFYTYFYAAFMRFIFLFVVDF